MDYSIDIDKDVAADNDDGSVSITYSLVNKPLLVAINIMSILVPLIFLAVFISIALRHPGQILKFNSLLIFLTPLVPMVLLNWIIRSRKNGTVCIQKSGLEFTNVSKFELLDRPARDWSDVHSVQLTYPSSMGRNFYPKFCGQKTTFLQTLKGMQFGPNVTFDFKSGGSATVELPALTRDQAEEFFSAVEKFGDPSKFATDFVKMQRAIVLERLDAKSFTQLWSESISPRYSSTSYVPLPTNHRLQDGRYEILMELAAGGMSAVYLAKADGVKVILKESVLPADISEVQKLKARELFEREAKLLLKLRHPQVAKVLDRFVEVGRDYLVLEYVPGLTLGQLAKVHGRQKEKKVLLWARQLTDILSYLHGQDPPVLHRDLTPDNIIIRADDSIFLIDFGAANEFVGQATGTMIGKQCYIAPEQLRGKATQMSDFYALGGTLYYLLTGEDPEPLASAHPKDKNDCVSQNLNDLVSKLTAFDSHERPNDAAAILKLLDEIDTAAGAKTIVKKAAVKKADTKNFGNY
ncbi:hypothetical protein BH11CYA1_BH11CYA1_38670 [soil metagenome]